MNGARAVNERNLEDASLSLSGCAFLCVYHAGVLAAIREHAPELLNNRISGASAGSIFAAAAVCNVCISLVTSIFLDVVAEARSYTFGALNRDFNLLQVVRNQLDKKLPEDAHLMCNGRLRISVTRLRDMTNVVISEFASKTEAICCSCFIPVYCGFVYPTFRGEVYIDGGASDNQPVIDDNTITVSPFSGESDICPSDSESASLFDWNFAGTSIRLTTNNLYRAVICLFPPTPQECAMMCRRGFQDAMKFLVTNGLARNSICFSIETDLSSDVKLINESENGYVHYKMHQGRMRPCNKSSANLRNIKSAPNFQKFTDDDDDQEENSTSNFMHLFPQVLQKALDESSQKGGFLQYLATFKVVKLANLMTMPIAATVQLFKFCQCLGVWLSQRLSKKVADDWVSERVKQIVDFLFQHIYSQNMKGFQRSNQQWAITEVEIGGLGSRPPIHEQILNIELSPEAKQERETLRKVDRLRLKRSRASADSIMSISMEGQPNFENEDALSHVIEQTLHHEAALAFYYKQSDNKVRICEIFDVERSDKPSGSHSTLFD